MKSGCGLYVGHNLRQAPWFFPSSLPGRQHLEKNPSDARSAVSIAKGGINSKYWTAGILQIFNKICKNPIANFKYVAQPPQTEMFTRMGEKTGGKLDFLFLSNYYYEWLGHWVILRQRGKIRQVAMCVAHKEMHECRPVLKHWAKIWNWVGENILCPIWEWMCGI